VNCIVTYQKSNGEIFIRPYDHSCFAMSKRVGDETSMGWTIIDIHYKYKNNYYCFDDFIKLFNREVKEKLNKKMLKFVIRKLNKLT